ncbi:MAG: hypothetical protein ABSB60_12395 [Terracidiphilus sp.]
MRLSCFTRRTAIALVLSLSFPVVFFTQSVPPGTGRYGTMKATKPKTTITSNQPATTKAPAAATKAWTATSEAATSSTITLGAAGAAPATLSATLETFVAEVNTDSASQKLTIENGSKTDTYVIGAGSNSGDDFTAFSMPLCPNTTLKPGDKCELEVIYHPTSVGNSSATIELSVINQTTKATQSISVPVSGVASSGCVQASHDFLPLSHKDVTDADINCFYNTSSNLAFLTDSKYLYNPGGSANTISGDLASLQFPGGFQLTLVGSANVNSCSNTSSTGSGTGSGGSGGSSGGSSGGDVRSRTRSYADSTTVTSQSNSSCNTSTNGSSTPSLSQDIQALTQGGNFALKTVWPIFNWRPTRFQFMAIASPQVSFNINGLTGQNTITGATNVNWFVPAEGYIQLAAIPPKDGGDSPGSIFVNYRGGWEHVSSQFATNAGLKSGDSFGLQQLSVGLALNGGIRISAQRYYGPEQAYTTGTGSTVSVNNFKDWQLSVQLSPTNVKKKSSSGSTSE